jgi:hypothetical protein
MALSGPFCGPLGPYFLWSFRAMCIVQIVPLRGEEPSELPPLRAHLRDARSERFCFWAEMRTLPFVLILY